MIAQPTHCLTGESLGQTACAESIYVKPLRLRGHAVRVMPFVKNRELKRFMNGTCMGP